MVHKSAKVESTDFEIEHGADCTKAELGACFCASLGQNIHAIARWIKEQREALGRDKDG
jgi:hypothetical protein